jgi:hypothetical protein
MERPQSKVNGTLEEESLRQGVDVSRVCKALRRGTLVEES